MRVSRNFGFGGARGAPGSSRAAAGHRQGGPGRRAAPAGGGQGVPAPAAARRWWRRLRRR